MRKCLSILMCIILIVTMSGWKSGDTSKNVTIVNKGTHFEIVLDFSDGLAHREMGEAYGEKILAAVPNFEALWDSYITEVIPSDDIYGLFLLRAHEIMPQIQQDYRDEIEGIASKLSAGSENVRGDGKLSKDELYLINLFPDVGRGTQCSGISVFGKRSSTKSTMTARVLDWYGGSKNQLANIQTVLTFKNGNKSICTISYMGYMGVISGFNDNKVFAAILDSSTGSPYTSTSKRSYPLDLRYALENEKTLDGVADYVKAKERSYTFSHLILLSDPADSKVLENNISSDVNNVRDVRSVDSALNNGVEWGFDNALGTVNSFILKGNHDNHTQNPLNIPRWSSMKSELSKKGNIVNLQELKEVISFNNGDGPGAMTDGDLYNGMTQQIIIFIPQRLHLEVAFRPKEGSLPNVPEFVRVPVSFQVK
ncbi:MAG: C45 family autoproteolytic acyltransferase/hydrolase [Clostridia bacterium]|nr:C45 family autoproteolytic acyltransferase/hydrolase [Clostridia bacterium]